MNALNLFAHLAFAAIFVTLLSTASAFDGIKYRMGVEGFSTAEMEPGDNHFVKYDLYLDIENFESLTQDEQDEKIKLVLKQLTLQSYSRKGSDENNLYYYAPISGIQVLRMGDDDVTNSVYGVTLLGVGGKKTYELKKVGNGTMKLTIEGELSGQYVLFNDPMKRDCPECISDVENYQEAYINPDMLDFGVSARIKVKLDVNDKFSISAYNNSYEGVGSGSHNFTHHKTYDDVYIPTHFENSFKYRETGLNLEYKKNSRLSFFVNVAQSRAHQSTTLREDDLNQDVTITTTDIVNNPDGSTDTITHQHTEYLYEAGQTKTFEKVTEDVNLTFGITWRFDNKPKRLKDKK